MGENVRKLLLRPQLLSKIASVLILPLFCASGNHITENWPVNKKAPVYVYPLCGLFEPLT